MGLTALHPRALLALALAAGCGDHSRMTAPTAGPAVKQCAEMAPLGSGAVCTVTPGDDAKLIQATILVPGTIYVGGEVAVDASGHITCVACDCSARATTATRITCPTGVVSPGLINTHDHLTFTQDPPYTDTGERYEQRHDWRLGLHGHTPIAAPGSASKDEVRWGELRFLMGGATSTVGAGGVAGFVRNLDDAALQEGLAQPAVDVATFPLGDPSGLQLGASCAYPFADTAVSIAGDDSYEAHIAEGIDVFARNEFFCASGSTNGGQDLAQRQSTFVHAIALDARDYALMATEGVGLVWSPRSNTALYGNTAVVTAAARLGVTIALGTDWLPTGSMNLLRELSCADEWNGSYLGGFFSDEQLWKMVTVNAAALTATGDVIGTLAAGMVADIVIFSGVEHAYHRAVIAAQPAGVVLVLRGGKVLYGDMSLVDRIPSTGTCDPIDVCGSAKSLCAAGDVGETYAQLQASVGGAIYPAFFCGAPANEPTCVPSRPLAVNGSTVYSGLPALGDVDGDGIADRLDNCPSVFNPVRPVDDGVQPDADGDGVGDACDPRPIDA